MTVDPIFKRLEMLTGTPAIKDLNQTRVVVFGVGGVGSWAADALVRSGIETITIVDRDNVGPTNVNRQLQATCHNVGLPKVHELEKRLELLNPNAQITALREAYEPATADSFDLPQYDYILDCIDSISCKAQLIQQAHESGITLFSSMGAACKLDPTQIQLGSIWNIKGCSLAKALRRRLRREGFGGEVQTVFSTEELPANEQGQDRGGFRKSINGSAAHITATFGMFLAGLVIQDVVSRSQTEFPLP
jgi:tRNA threonylcarbamoyladenosine dehydratase